MRLYVEIARRSFRRALAYRMAFVAGAITNAFFGAVRSYIYLALYGTGSMVAGLSVHDTITYTWVTQALLSIGTAWIFTDIMQTIRSGDVVTDLSRPWSFYGAWLSRIGAGQLCQLLTRGVLTMSCGVLLFGAAIPSPPVLLAFVCSVALAMLVSFGFGFLVNLTAFWLVDATGVQLFANVLLNLFSGMMIPLAFFPPAVESVARALPFHAITALPTEIYLGKYQGTALLGALATQGIWAVVLLGIALAVQQLAFRKLVVQGG